MAVNGKNTWEYSPAIASGKVLTEWRFKVFVTPNYLVPSYTIEHARSLSDWKLLGNGHNCWVKVCVQ